VIGRAIVAVLGRGSVEPFSLKLQNRFLPFFAMGFVFLLLVFLAVALYLGTANFDKIIGFAGTLIGSITGYYFGGKHIETSTSISTEMMPRSQRHSANNRRSPLGGVPAAAICPTKPRPWLQPTTQPIEICLNK
jgi:hypothetical protein